MYQLLMIYVEFFAVGEDFATLTSILKTMKIRQWKATRMGVELSTPCTECKQLFKDQDTVIRHQNHKRSTCGKIKRLFALATLALAEQRNLSQSFQPSTNLSESTAPIVVTDPSPFLFRVGDTHITAKDMDSLRDKNQCVTSLIIDAFQNISQQLDWDSHYFHIAFFQCLVNSVTGYNYDNVADWPGDINILAKAFIYIPVIHNAHYILLVVDTKNKMINSYDSVAGDREEIMRLVLRYLHDESQRRALGSPTTPPSNSNVFCMADWSTMNVFTQATKIQNNSTDCGVYVMKFVEFLRQSMNVFSITRLNIDEYRQHLVRQLENNQN